MGFFNFDPLVGLISPEPIMALVPKEPCPDWTGDNIRLKIHHRWKDEIWEGPCCCVSCALAYLEWPALKCTITAIKPPKMSEM